MQKPQDTDINLIRSKLVNEISADWNIERDSTKQKMIEQPINNTYAWHIETVSTTTQSWTLRGHIPKHKLQHALISCIEAYVNETYLNEYKMIKPT